MTLQRREYAYVPRYRIIYAKRTLFGLLASAGAVFITVWAIDTYAGRVSPFLIAAASSLATFYMMTIALRGAVKEAYRAGEVGRRLPRSVEQRAIGHDREVRSVPSKQEYPFKAPPLIQSDLVGSNPD